MRLSFLLLATFLSATVGTAQSTSTLIGPDRIFDGTSATVRTGFAVLVEGDRIVAVGPAETLRARAGTIINAPGTTLLPGMIDAHAHVLLHPYNETNWTDQVLKESLAERV